MGWIRAERVRGHAEGLDGDSRRAAEHGSPIAEPRRARNLSFFSKTRGGCSSGAQETERGTGSIEVARPGVYNIRFSAGKSMKEKLVRFGEVFGIDGAAKHMAEIFEKALDLALEKKDPQRKLERRRKRQAVRSRTRLDEANPPKTRLDEVAGAATSLLSLSPCSIRGRASDWPCIVRSPSGMYLLTHPTITDRDTTKNRSQR